MAVQDLSFRGFPNLALEEGATTPNPGTLGAWAWSTTLVKPMFWNGVNWTAGSAGGGGGTPAGNTGELQYNNAGAFGGAANVEVHGGDLIMVAGTPTVPVVNTVKMFGKKLGNTRIVPAAMGPSGMDFALQPALFSQKCAIWSPGGNANTVPGIFGGPAMTVTGTATSRNVATTNMMTRMRRLGYVSAATATSSCSVRGQTQYTTGNAAATPLGGFYASFRFAFSDAAAVAGARAFVGMDSATPTNVEMNTRLNNVGLAQLSTDSTQLYLVYGGSAAQTAIALGTGFPPMTAAGATNGVPYDFQIWAPPSLNGVVNWQLDRLDTGTSTGGTITPATPGVQTPLNTTLLAPTVYRGNNATAAAVGTDISTIYIETDY